MADKSRNALPIEETAAGVTAQARREIGIVFIGLRLAPERATLGLTRDGGSAATAGA